MHPAGFFSQRNRQQCRPAVSRTARRPAVRSRRVFLAEKLPAVRPAKFLGRSAGRRCIPPGFSRRQTASGASRQLSQRNCQRCVPPSFRTARRPAVRPAFSRRDGQRDSADFLAQRDGPAVRPPTFSRRNRRRCVPPAFSRRNRRRCVPPTFSPSGTAGGTARRFSRPAGRPAVRPANFFPAKLPAIGPAVPRRRRDGRRSGAPRARTALRSVGPALPRLRFPLPLPDREAERSKRPLPLVSGLPAEAVVRAVEEAEARTENGTLRGDRGGARSAARWV